MASEAAEVHDPDGQSPAITLRIFFGQYVRTKTGIAVIVCTLAILVFVIWQLVEQGVQTDSKDTHSPSYQTVIPKGKTIAELGGWKRINPPKASPVYTYSDTLDNISIIVSQQPLPLSFNGNVAELAKKFNATDKIDANGTDVYIGTSAKGPQWTIFTKNGLLILIKSQKHIDDKAWAYYVESLIGTDPSLTNF